MCLKCSFCGNIENKALKIIEGPDFNICSNCFDICKDEFSEKFMDLENISSEIMNLLKPHEIKKKLDEFVVGQEETKRVLSVAVYNHYKRITAKSTVDVQKTNIMMIGPTGSGKTYIIQTLAKILNVPLLITDATSFTEAGYVGDNVEDILKRLYLKAGKNLKLAEKGIVYIDEVDKILSKSDDSSKRDVNGMGVQQGLLKIVEDSDVTFKLKENELNQKEIVMNTKNILFIVGGAFIGLDKVIEERIRKSKGVNLGFFKQSETIEEDVNENEITSEDIIKYGMIPEFVGRIPVYVKVNKLTDEELENILTKPKNSITKQYKSLLKLDGVKLSFDKDSLKYIVAEAQKKKLGARGLRGVLDKQMNAIMYEIPQYSKIKELTITKDLLVTDINGIKKILKQREAEN